MPEVVRPDGARIHYEVRGSGFPLLLIAPGGLNSEIPFWRNAPIDPFERFSDEFMVVAMDQRHAGQSWQAPRTFSYELAIGDQLAVLDAAGVDRAHVWGGCIGVAHLLQLIHTAPGRIAAGVGQNPVGLDATNSRSTFTAMFEPTIALARSRGVAAVVASALDDPSFVMNNAAGPFARGIAADAAFRGDIETLEVDEYVAAVEEIANGIWPDAPPFFTVDEEWLARCPAPLLVLPGTDEFHPTSVAERICATAPRARCLEVGWGAPERVEATAREVREFLHAHSS